MDNYRDEKGRFINGYKQDDVPIEIRIKKANKNKESWKNRDDYIMDLVNQYPKIYNSWRAFMFTEKEKKAGHDERWNSFRTFYEKVKRDSKTVKDFKDASQGMRAKASKMISAYKCRDKKNGFDKVCDITIEWMVENIFKSKCVYRGDTYRLGCDRIDNTKGHTMDNVVPCCIECNQARNNKFTHEEMFTLGKAIAEIKQKRKMI